MVSPDDLDIVMRLGTAVVCGGIIGFERDQRGRPTGFRTLALVCLGSCVAVLSAIKAGDSDGFSRVAQGIVTGIGFLGGGVILRGSNLRNVKGLTTAAAIWLTAAIGLLCGIGELKIAFIATAMALVLLMLDNVSDKFRTTKEDGADRTPDETSDQKPKAD